MNVVPTTSKPRWFSENVLWRLFPPLQMSFQMVRSDFILFLQEQSKASMLTDSHHGLSLSSLMFHWRYVHEWSFQTQWTTRSNTQKQQNVTVVVLWQQQSHFLTCEAGKAWWMAAHTGRMLMVKQRTDGTLALCCALPFERSHYSSHGYRRSQWNFWNILVLVSCHLAS